MTMSSPAVESVHISGDRDTGHGHRTEFDMTGGAFAKVKLTYAGRHARPFAELVIECEVYKAPDGMLSVHSICPRCGNGCMIRGDQKAISLEGDRLFIEPFRCKFMLQESLREDTQGTGQCGIRVAYDGKVVKDA